MFNTVVRNIPFLKLQFTKNAVYKGCFGNSQMQHFLRKLRSEKNDNLVEHGENLYHT